jgi:hypothetical protein
MIAALQGRYNVVDLKLRHGPSLVASRSDNHP